MGNRTYLQEIDDLLREIINICIFMVFPGGSDGKESTCNVRDLDLIPGWGRSPGERNGYLLQYSCLENSMDRGASMGYSPQVRKESNTTERLTLSLHFSAMSLETLGIKRLPIHGPKLLIPHLLHHHPQREQGNL